MSSVRHPFIVQWTRDTFPCRIGSLVQAELGPWTPTHPQQFQFSAGYSSKQWSDANAGQPLGGKLLPFWVGGGCDQLIPGKLISICVVRAIFHRHSNASEPIVRVACVPKHESVKAIPSPISPSTYEMHSVNRVPFATVDCSEHPKRLRST